MSLVKQQNRPLNINYNADGSVKSKSGYYYTYDEDGTQTKHNGIPAE